MKKLNIILLILCLSAFSVAQNVNIPDANFKNELLKNYHINKNFDTQITVSEAMAFKGTLDVSAKLITDLTGIEAFVNLTILNCAFNDLTSLDLSKNTSLNQLFCQDNQIKSLDVSNNISLTDLWCNQNDLMSLDVDNNISLVDFNCSDNQLTNLDVSKNLDLKYFYCSINKLTSLDVSNNISLIYLSCGSNDSLSEICIASSHNISRWDKDGLAKWSRTCGQANVINIPDANFKAYLVGNTAINTDNDSEISVVEATAFTGTIDCSSKNISDLTGIEAFTALTKLFCGGNQLTSLDVSNNTGLTNLKCESNQLTSLDVSNNTSLTLLDCQINKLTKVCVSSSHTTTSWKKDTTATWSTTCGQASIVNIPDANFKAYLVGNTAINTDNDSEISVAEATAFTGTIDCYNKNISDLTGIEAFTGLTKLWCYRNKLTSLDVSNNTSLTELYCNENQLTSLDVSNNTSLTYLGCNSNPLTSLDISNNTSLIDLRCHSNQLTSLDVSNNTSLTKLRCYSNQLTSLDVSNNTSLTYLDCEINQITSICVSSSHKTTSWYKDPTATWSTTCTVGLEEEVSEKGLTIIKAYNLQGQEVPINTKGEVIILLYDNGTREKTYVIQ